MNNACDNVTMSDTLLTIIPKDFYKDRCVIGYGYEVGKLRFKHISPRLVWGLMVQMSYDAVQHQTNISDRKTPATTRLAFALYKVAHLPFVLG